MATVVIVTNQCYLLCEAINYITVDEVDDTDDNEWRPRAPRHKKIRNKPKIQNEYMNTRKPYNIVIDFIPVSRTAQNSSNSGSNNNQIVNIRVHGLERCLSLFQDMVSQIREQIPDQLFLDKMVERFLTAGEK